MKRRSTSLMKQVLKLKSASNRLFLFALFLFFSSQLCAQHLLIVEHEKKTTRLRFHENDIIGVYTHKGWMLHGLISSIDDSSMVIEDRKIVPADISYVFIERAYIRTPSKFLRAAGIGYIALDVLNSSLNGDRPLLSPSNIIPAIVVSGSGVILGLFDRKKYKASRGFTFKLLDISP